MTTSNPHERYEVAFGPTGLCTVVDSRTGEIRRQTIDANEARQLASHLNWQERGVALIRTKEDAVAYFARLKSEHVPCPCYAVVTGKHDTYNVSTTRAHVLKALDAKVGLRLCFSHRVTNEGVRFVAAFLDSDG